MSNFTTTKCARRATRWVAGKSLGPQKRDARRRNRRAARIAVRLGREVEDRLLTGWEVC